MRLWNDAIVAHLNSILALNHLNNIVNDVMQEYLDDPAYDNAHDNVSMDDSEDMWLGGYFTTLILDPITLVYHGYRAWTTDRWLDNTSSLSKARHWVLPIWHNPVSSDLFQSSCCPHPMFAPSTTMFEWHFHRCRKIHQLDVHWDGEYIFTMSLLLSTASIHL